MNKLILAVLMTVLFTCASFGQVWYPVPTVAQVVVDNVHPADQGSNELVAKQCQVLTFDPNSPFTDVWSGPLTPGPASTNPESFPTASSGVFYASTQSQGWFYMTLRPVCTEGGGLESSGDVIIVSWPYSWQWVQVFVHKV